MATKRTTIADLMRDAEEALANADYSAAEELAVRAQALMASRPKLGKGGIAGVQVEYTPEAISEFLINVRRLQARVQAKTIAGGKRVKIRNKAVS